MINVLARVQVSMVFCVVFPLTSIAFVYCQSAPGVHITMAILESLWLNASFNKCTVEM